MNQAPSWLTAAQALLILLLGWIGRMISLTLQEVRKINGRLTRLEEYRIAHDHWAGEGAIRNDREHGEMRDAIDDLRKQTHHG